MLLATTSEEKERSMDCCHFSDMPKTVFYHREWRNSSRSNEMFLILTEQGHNLFSVFSRKCGCRLENILRFAITSKVMLNHQKPTIWTCSYIVRYSQRSTSILCTLIRGYYLVNLKKSTHKYHETLNCHNIQVWQSSKLINVVHMQILLDLCRSDMYRTTTVPMALLFFMFNRAVLNINYSLWFSL